MNAIQPSYHKRIKYTLYNTVYGPKTISQPIGWDKDEKTFKRDPNVHGIFSHLSKNLKFYRGDENNDGGFDYITGVRKQQGVKAVVLLVKEEKHPETDIWQEAYRGHLDFLTLEIENNKASIAFDEFGLNTSIKARQSEKLELDRLETMDGDAIDPLVRSKVALDGRDIFLESALKLNTSSENPITIDHGPGQVFQARALPLTIKGESDDLFQSITDLFVDESGSSYDPGKAAHMFYNISDRNKTFKLTFDVDYSWTSLTPKTVRLDLVTYENGSNYDYKSTAYENLITVNAASGSVQFNDTVTVNLLAGESLALVTHSTADFPAGATPLTYTWVKTDVINEENSFFDKSQADFVLAFEALERMIYITTGQQNALLSNFLGRTDIGYAADGAGSLMGITSGLWVRGFNDKSLTTSLKDFTSSYSAVNNAGYGIEKIGLKEHVRYEELEYFYQVVVMVSLPFQITKMKRKTAKDYFYTGMEFGFEKGAGDNEEVQGLQEYNAKNTFTNTLDKGKKIYSKVSKYVGGSLPMEFARRKSILTNPTDDTRFDFYVFMMDLKRGSTEVFEQRLWQDDFAKEPTGVYSPETAQNLRYTPFNILQRHGWWIRAGVNDYKDSFVRFSSSTGFSDMSTQLIGGNEYAEDGKIKVSELEEPLFNGWIYEFEHPVDTELFQKVQAKTLIDGDYVMNYYGLFEFINESGYYEYGYLLNLKPNGNGKWVLLGSSKKASKKSVLPEPIPGSTENEVFDYTFDLPLN